MFLDKRYVCEYKHVIQVGIVQTFFEGKYSIFANIGGGALRVITLNIHNITKGD